MPSYFVHRTNRGTSREGWTGPIRSYRQALKEQASWETCTDSFGEGYNVVVCVNTPEVRRQVRAWEKELKLARR